MRSAVCATGLLLFPMGKFWRMVILRRFWKWVNHIIWKMPLSTWYSRNRSCNMGELFNKIAIVFRKEWRDSLRDNKSLRMTLLMPIYFVGVFVASSMFVIHMSNQSRATNNEPIKLSVVGAEQLPHLIDWLQERG